MLALALLAAPLASGAQPAGKVARVGVLTMLPPPPEGVPSSLTAPLRALGWVEGQNLVLERRFAAGREERLPELAAELVRLGMDVLVTETSAGVRAIKRATGTVPIVMFGVGDPAGLGLVTSLARPGGNVTGMTWAVSPEVAGKQLQLLKEVVPTVSRMGVLWAHAYGRFEAMYGPALQAAADALGVQLERFEVREPQEFDEAFAAMRKKRVGALLVYVWGIGPADQRKVVALAAAHRLPALYESVAREWVDAGGLMSHGPVIADMARGVAGYVDRILRGAKPAELPVELPTRYHLIINLRTAKALGLTIPPSLLVQADQLIQ
jgi:putative ABC transport system substrate-binding protein